MSSQINQSVVRAFDILRLFDESRSEITTAEVADELELGFVTAHRYLRTLEHIGVLMPVAKGRYRLSYIFVDICDRMLKGDSAGRVLQPLLNILTSELQETSTAAIFHAGMITCIASAMPRRRSSVDIQVGSRLDAFRTAHGRVWLAFMPKHQATNYLETFERTRFTPSTPVTRQELEVSIRETRRLGYIISDSEYEDDIRMIAVPCFAQGGRMIASLAVLGPASRLTNDIVNLAKERLRATATSAKNRLYNKGLFTLG